MNDQATNFDTQQASRAQKIGRILREGREAAGLQVEDVALSIKLTVRQIEAIEAGLFDQLPGGQFTRGFIRNYAKLLGMDERSLLEMLDEPNSGEQSFHGMALGPRMPERRKVPRDNSVLPALGLAFGLLLLVVAGWHFQWFASSDVALLKQPVPAEPKGSGAAPAVQPVKPVQDPTTPGNVNSAPTNNSSLQEASPQGATSLAQTTTVNPVAVIGGTPTSNAVGTAPVTLPSTAAGAPSVAASTSTPAPLTQANTAPTSSVIPNALVFNFSDNAWVQVRDSTGKVLLAKIGEAGSSQEVQGTPPFSLVVGNASKVNLRYKGEAVDLMPYAKVNVAKLTLD